MVSLLLGCESGTNTEEKLVPLTPPNTEQYKEHIKFLTLLIEKNPNSDKLYYQRCLANFRAGRMRAARRDIEDAIKISRYQPKYHYQKALIENRFNQIQEALNSALTAQDEGYNHPDLTALLGELYFKAGNFAQAKSYLLECENNSYYSDSTTLLYLSQIFFNQADTLAARRRLEPLLHKYPRCTEAADLLMQLHINKAQSRKAIDIYNKSAQYQAVSPSMMTTVATAYLRLKKEDSALYYFEKAYKNDSTQWRAALALKDQKISEKNLKEAVKYYEAALRHNPLVNKGFFDLGFIYEYYFFDFEKAQNCYQKAIKYFPDDKKASQALGRVDAKKAKGRNYFLNPPKAAKDSVMVK